METGIRVVVETGPWIGRVGTIEKRVGEILLVQLEARGLARVHVDDVTIEQATDQQESGTDFDGGFGVGGLARYAEEPIVPTAAQVERVERMERQARRCRSCGCTDVFDGVMFTTDASSGLCDDCYG